MRGKMRCKETKMILNAEERIKAVEIVEEIRKILYDPSVVIPRNFMYRDTYYDDSELSLFKQGGSLKVREGILDPRNIEKSLIMRTLTKNPKKMIVTPWDEAEVSAPTCATEFADTFKPLKGLFPEFSFDKINQTPILICSTVRTEYKIVLEDDKTIKLLFDHITYQKDDKQAEDYILKIRSKTFEQTDMLYAKLCKTFKCQLVTSSRYERAFEKLMSQTS